MAMIQRRLLEDHSYHVNVDDAKQLSDRIAQIFSFVLERRGPVLFSDIVSIAPLKQEAVLSFLAVVFLTAEGRINSKQKTPYGEIFITAGGAAG
jgi:chromatin segregation and condensation protein Rec8/ScpA/Scc1 (kleisin family)